MKKTNKKNVAAALLIGILLTFPAFAENIIFDTEDGIWVESGDISISDQTGFVSGYMTILRGHVIYRDANRTDPLGYPLEESVVYAKRVRVYEKGAVYQVRFDTTQTKDGEKCVTGYYYTQYPRMADTEPMTDGARILDNIAIPLIRFHYGAETGAESQFNVVTASGTAFVTKPDTNLREGPGAEYNYVARLAKNTKVTITGFNINKNITWYYIYDDEGNRGFVRADLLSDLPSTAISAMLPEEKLSSPEGEENPEIVENSESVENLENEENSEEEENQETGENSGDDENPESEENPETENEDKDKKIEVTERHIWVSLSWEKAGTEPTFGNQVILIAHLEGYDDVAYKLQWQTSTDGEFWTDVLGATMPSLILTMTEENYCNYWRVLVTVEESTTNMNALSDDTAADRTDTEL